MRRSMLVAAALLTLAVGAAGWWLHAPDLPVDALRARWAPPPSQWRAVDGLTAHVRDEGVATDSVPVLLLHGTSASLHTWEGWSAVLRPTRRVISVDLPGFGLTGPDPRADYRVERYTRFVVALMDSLHVARVDLVGNSLGGEIAWHVAARHPARVHRLVLIDPAGFPVASQSVPLGFRLARDRRFSWLMTRILPRRVVTASVRDVYGDTTRVTDALVDRYLALTRRAGNRAALPARFAQSRPGADTMLLTRVISPTLILWGARDRLIPPATAARFQHLLPGAQVLLYPGLGHVPHEEDATRTATDALAFLTSP